MIDITGSAYDKPREYATYRRVLLDENKRTSSGEVRTSFDPKNPDNPYFGLLGSAVNCFLRGVDPTDLNVDRKQKYDFIDKDGNKVSDKTIVNIDNGMPADDLHDGYLNNLLFCDGSQFAVLFENMPSEELKLCPTYERYGKRYIRQADLPQQYKVKGI